MTFLKILLLSAIAVYRKAVSPLLPASCRFYPSCSQYAADAVERHGAVRGALMVLGRITRCHPWHSGGYDPAPASAMLRGGDVTARKVRGIETGATAK